MEASTEMDILCWIFIFIVAMIVFSFVVWYIKFWVKVIKWSLKKIKAKGV